jgi:NAD(P)-dependent dehydrogenase (short-subunit alcohol dehydrogenase family)
VTSTRKRVALLTGAARGIGLACAERLAGQGHHVVVVDLAASEDAAAAIASRGGSASGRQCDLGDSEAVDVLIDGVLAEFGGCDILVNNVAHGGGARGPFAEHDRELWRRTFAVHFQAAVQLTTAPIDLLRTENPEQTLSCAHNPGYRSNTLADRKSGFDSGHVWIDRLDPGASGPPPRRSLRPDDHGGP